MRNASKLPISVSVGCVGPILRPFDGLSLMAQLVLGGTGRVTARGIIYTIVVLVVILAPV